MKQTLIPVLNFVKNIKKIFTLFAFIFSLFLLIPTSVQSKVPTDILTPPTVLSPVSNQILTNSTVSITGVTYNNSQVDIYINDEFAGKAKVKNGKLGIASWSYIPKTKLPIGKNSVYAISKSENSVFKSKPSQKIFFQIKHEVPAPILLSPEIKGKNYKKPMIKGFAKSNLWIEVFIDGKLNGKFKTADHPSKTVSFSYKPFLDLKEGWHSVKVRAVESDGRKSRFSRPILMEITSKITNRTNKAPQLISKPHSEKTLVVAPTIITPKAKTVLSTQKPEITGLSWEEQIEIYINDKFFGYAETKKHQNGIVSFYYKPNLNLIPDDYKVYAVSVNKKGQRSGISNTTHFIIKSKTPYIITPSGVTKLENSVVKSTTTTTIIKPKEDNQKQNNENIADDDEQNENTLTEAEDNKQNKETDDSENDKNEEKENNAVFNKEDTENNNKKAIFFAIIAIIIIGIISWFTSKEKVDEKTDDEKNENNTDNTSSSDNTDNNDKNSDKQDKTQKSENTSIDKKTEIVHNETKQDTVWKEEPTDTTPPPPPSI